MKATYRVSASILGLIMAMPALAQAPAEADSSASDASNEIVVTAQKREQSLQDVPLSITAIAGDTLAERGINDVTTLSTSVPGLNFGQSGSDARPAMRGVRTEEVDAGNDPVIGFFVDGAYKPRTSQALAAFIDLERVEVLRGPQGTLFGRNTYGGSINLISKLPEADFGGSASVRYASYNDIRIEGMLNLPLGASSGLRLVGFWQQSDGYVKVLAPRIPGVTQANDFNDSDQVYIRGILQTDISDNVELIVRGSHWDQGGNGAGGFGYTTVGTLRQTAGATPGTATGTQDLSGFLDRNNPRTGAAPGPSDVDPYHVYRNTNLTRSTKETTFNGELNVDLEGVRFKSLTSYADFSSNRKSDEDFSEGAGSDFELDTASKSFSQELQVVSDYESPLQWVGGLYYFSENVVEDFLFRTPTNPSAFLFRQDVETRSIAAYAQADYAITDTITLVLGGRYTSDSKDFIYQSPPGAVDLFPDKGKFKRFTWNAGVNVDLTPDNLLYASVKTGFRSGGFNNGGNPPVPKYGPQSVIAYEVGLKNNFRDLGMTLNLSAFYNRYTDILTSSVTVVGPTTLTARSNAGSARSYGLEAELTWNPTDELRIDVNGTYLNAKFGKYAAFRPLAQATGYIIVPGTTNVLDLRGNRVPLSPEFTLSAGAEYRISLGSAGTITPNARVFLSSSYELSEFNFDGGIPGRPVGRQGSYTKTDLSITWTSENENFMVQGFVQNLEDKAVLNRVAIGGQGAIFQNFSAPRIFGVKAGVKF